MSASTNQPKQTEQSRRHFSPEKKAEILHRHLVDKVPISQLCDEIKLQRSVFYCWQTQLFERAAQALSAPKPAASQERPLEDEIAMLEAKLQKKEERREYS